MGSLPFARSGVERNTTNFLLCVQGRREGHDRLLFIAIRSIFDEDGPDVAGFFLRESPQQYGRDGRYEGPKIDGSRAAPALHDATRRPREKGGLI